MPRNKVLISFAILTILIPVVLFFVSKNFSLKKPATVTPSPTSRALSLEEQINNCSITKEGNPLVNDVQVFKTGEKEAMVGTFRANINKVYPDSTKLSPSIELVSPRGDQTHTFRVTEEKGLVYDAVKIVYVIVYQVKIAYLVYFIDYCVKEVIVYAYVSH